jgi:hypothetical protein
LHYYLDNVTGDLAAYDCGTELHDADRHAALARLLAAIIEHDPDAIYDAHIPVLGPAAGRDVLDGMRTDFVDAFAREWIGVGDPAVAEAHKLVAALDDRPATNGHQR